LIQNNQSASEPLTSLLARANAGDRAAFDDLMPLVYHELHRIAESYLRRELTEHTLQPTALIHEAYLRLANYQGIGYQSRKHFYAVAARVMRRILVDHARARGAAKRGGSCTVRLERDTDFAAERDGIVVALDDALTALANHDGPKAELVEMRFFAGLTAEEIASCTDAPVHSIRRELRSAQVWLRQAMEA